MKKVCLISESDVGNIEGLKLNKYWPIAGCLRVQEDAAEFKKLKLAIAKAPISEFIVKLPIGVRPRRDKVDL